MTPFLKETDEFFSRFMAPITKRLFYINALAFIVINILFAISPALTQRVFFLTPNQAVFQGNLWQFVTYMFAHLDFFHFFSNMLALFFFGSLIEKHMAGRRYLRFLLTAGLLAGMVHTVLALVMGKGMVGLVGFSAAVFAIITATVMYFPKMRVNLYFVFPVPMRVVAAFFGVLLAMEMINDVVQYGLFSGRVSHVAHLTGILTAIVLIKVPFIMDWIEDLYIPLLQRRPRMIRGKNRMNMGHPGRHSDPDDRYNDPHWYLDQ